MCGRYSQAHPSETVRTEFHVIEWTEFLPRYNIAPSQLAPVIDLYKWGLISSWAKDLSIGYKMINARCETVGEKPGDGQKTPMRILMKDKSPFAMADLWDEWRNAEGVPLRSYPILTTKANELLRDVHDRMPVILRPKLIDAWLDPEVKLAEMAGVFAPFADEAMNYYPVPKMVNSPKNDSSECWERVGT